MTAAKVKFKIQRHVKGYNTEVFIKPLDAGTGGAETSQLENINAATAASTGPDGVKRIDSSSSVSWKQAAIYGNMAKVARTGFNFVVANYGDLTSDYAGGVRLQESLEVAGNAVNVVGSFLLAGPAGAVAAGVGVALSYATQLGTDIIRNNKRNAASAVMRERYGIATRGGGR